MDLDIEYGVFSVYHLKIELLLLLLLWNHHKYPLS